MTSRRKSSGAHLVHLELRSQTSRAREDTICGRSKFVPLFMADELNPDKLHCTIKLCKPCNYSEGTHLTVLYGSTGRRALRTSPHHAFSNRRTTFRCRGARLYEKVGSTEQSTKTLTTCSRAIVSGAMFKTARADTRGQGLVPLYLLRGTSRPQTKQSGRAAMYHARSPYAHGVLRI